jgi:hypothetical protein
MPLARLLKNGADRSQKKQHVRVNPSSEKSFYLVDFTVKFLTKRHLLSWEKAMILPARSSTPVMVVTLAIWFSGGGLATAACYAPDQQLPAQSVSDFLNNPSQFLQDAKNAEGGADMIALVRDFVASNPAALPAVIALLDKASPAQQTAIGTGLGQAASLCIRPDPTFAADIQTQLAGTTSDAAKNAYAAVTGNQPIRSVAGGGGVSGGSSGGSTGGTLGSPTTGTAFTQFSSNSILNTSTNFFTGSTGSAGSAGTGGTTSTTSVSP